MFDIIMITLFTSAIIGVIVFTFKPVLDTMKRDELERKQKNKSDHTVPPA
jgi:hypothetical protein